ncbi:MAG TPA: ABC transporter substrate-binding protein [Dissulfurispiraceae bacterium]|nr:ABC transporter substrate-binding protein [Dissulfurispiraceae bacterium]
MKNSSSCRCFRCLYTLSSWCRIYLPMPALNRICCAIISVFLLGMSANPVAQAEIFVYTDKLDRIIQIKSPVKRAIIFSTYEVIPALGLWDQVVGVGRYAYQNDIMRAVRPNIAQEYLSAGSGMDVNAEAVLKAKPDLVITWAIKPESVRYLEQHGLTVAAVHPESIEELHEAIRFHGVAFGREARARQIIAESKRLFSLIEKKTGAIPPERRKKVLWLSSKPTTVAGGTGMYDDLVKAIGSVNPAAGYGQRYVEVSLEKIIAWNPDVIFIWGNAKYSVHDVLKNPQWRYVRAVKGGQVYKAPEWSAFSPRAAAAALLMAAKVYPDQFSAADVDKELDAFYQRVFSVSYAGIKKAGVP